MNDVARRNVRRSVELLLTRSPTLAGLVKEGRVEVVGAIYDVATGNLEFLTDDGGPSGPIQDKS